MVNAGQKKKERDLLLEFKTLYSEFPNGEIDDDESPDFLISGDEGSIGIEIEEYIRGQKMGKGSGGSPIRQVENNQSEFLRVAQNIYQAKQLEPLIVDFSWYGNKHVDHKDIRLLAEYVVGLIVAILPLNTSSQVRIGREQFDDTPLEEYLSSIFLSKPVGLKSSKWNNYGTAFWGLGIDEIENLISSKERKIHQHLEKCSQVWLLIVADGEQTSSTVDFSNDQFTRIFQTKFSKVFLYDRPRQKIEILSK